MTTELAFIFAGTAVGFLYLVIEIGRMIAIHRILTRHRKSRVPKPNYKGTPIEINKCDGASR